MGFQQAVAAAHTTGKTFGLDDYTREEVIKCRRRGRAIKMRYTSSQEDKLKDICNRLTLNAKSLPKPALLIAISEAIGQRENDPPLDRALAVHVLHWIERVEHQKYFTELNGNMDDRFPGVKKELRAAVEQMSDQAVLGVIAGQALLGYEDPKPESSIRTVETHPQVAPRLKPGIGNVKTDVEITTSSPSYWKPYMGINFWSKSNRDEGHTRIDSLRQELDDLKAKFAIAAMNEDDYDDGDEGEALKDRMLEVNAEIKKLEGRVKSDKKKTDAQDKEVRALLGEVLSSTMETDENELPRRVMELICVTYRKMIESHQEAVNVLMEEARQLEADGDEAGSGDLEDMRWAPLPEELQRKWEEIGGTCSVLLEGESEYALHEELGSMFAVMMSLMKDHTRILRDAVGSRSEEGV